MSVVTLDIPDEIFNEINSQAQELRVSVDRYTSSILFTYLLVNKSFIAKTNSLKSLRAHQWVVARSPEDLYGKNLGVGPVSKQLQAQYDGLHLFLGVKTQHIPSLMRSFIGLRYPESSSKIVAAGKKHKVNLAIDGSAESEENWRPVTGATFDYMTSTWSPIISEEERQASMPFDFGTSHGIKETHDSNDVANLAFPACSDDAKLDWNKIVEKNQMARKWIEEHRNEYLGQWVCLDGDTLIAVGDDAESAYAEANRQGIQAPFLKQIPKEKPDFSWGGWD